MRLYPHIMAETAVADATDRVINSIAIPGRSTLRHVWMDFSLVRTVQQDVLDGSMYGVTAYIVPMLDPDATPDVNAIWDLQIPKDDTIGPDSIDMDFSDTADATPEIEPGDPSLEELFNVASRPARIFQRTELITFGKQSAGFTAGTPDTFRPRDAWKAEIKQHYFVEQPSVLMFGLSAPATTSTGSVFNPSSNEEWLQLRFMADTAKDAWKHAVGLFETGAETPYVEAAALIASFLEQFTEETTGAWIAAAYRIFTDFRYEIEVEGELSIESISAGA